MDIKDCKPGLAVNVRGASQPGEILAVNTKTGVVTVEYKRGARSAVTATLTAAAMEPIPVGQASPRASSPGVSPFPIRSLPSLTSND